MELDLEVSDKDQVGTEVGPVSNIGSVASLATAAVVYWVFRRC